MFEFAAPRASRPTTAPTSPHRLLLKEEETPGVITPTQPEVPGAKIRGSQKGFQVFFQWVILGLDRVPGVLKGVPRGPVGPPGPPELAALGDAHGHGEGGGVNVGVAADIIPYHETFSTTIQPPYSSTKG